MTTWRNPITVQGLESADGRLLAQVEWGTFPLPLRWDREDDGAHAGAVATGVIERTWLASDAEKAEFEFSGAGELWMGEGHYLDVSAAADAITLAKAGVGFLSVDPGGKYEYHYEILDADNKEVDIKDVYKAQDKVWYGDDEDGSAEEWLSSLRERTVFDLYTSGGATQVDIPCFPQCRMRVADDATVETAARSKLASLFPDEPPAGPGGVNNTAPEVMAARSILRRLAAGPAARPAAAYAEKAYTGYTPFHIDAYGFMSGHIAGWNACHRGFAQSCVKPTYQTSFDEFHTGWVTLDDGSEMRVGVITHVDGHLNTAAEYDKVASDPGCQLGSCRLYADQWGIQVAGMVHADVDADTCAKAVAGAPSGDWRNDRLYAIAMVNTPGYVAYGTDERLVASIPPPAPTPTAREDAFFDLPDKVLTAACPCKETVVEAAEDCGCGGHDECTCDEATAAAKPTPEVLLGLAQLEQVMKLRDPVSV